MGLRESKSEYFLRRSRDEADAAVRAASPREAAIHTELAELYRARAGAAAADG